MGVVQQDVFIHTSSIRDNVAYGAADADFDKVVEMTRMAQLHDFIDELPEGYATVVGERGVGLSGGQKQRLSIARTVLLNPPVLVLDDSTSSVDVHTERLIQQALDAVIAERTTFLISNRFHAIAKAMRFSSSRTARSCSGASTRSSCRCPASMRSSTPRR